MHLRRFAAGVLGALTLAAGLTPAAGLAQESQPAVKVNLDHPFAAFLESRAYAAAQGATAEFRKMEGVALDPVNRKLYVAMSEIGRSMSDQQGDIQLEANQCGVVYGADLDENWNITALEPVVVGGPYDPANEENPCSVDSIANPDNLFVDAQGNLWIGEDTGNHANNYLWMWDGKELKRFASVPRGAEVTGLYVAPNGTVFLNIQHPDAMNPYPYNRGVIGVVTGFKAGQNFASLRVPAGENQHKVMLAAGRYQVLARAGEPIPGSVQDERFGQRTFADGSVEICNNPDGNMFLPTTAEGNEGYLYTNFECRPGAVARTYIRRTAQGQWEILEGENVDFMPVQGTWNNCFASVTPWNTGLSSEEYEPYVDKEWESRVEAMTAYLGRQANPYDYGYNVELAPRGVDTRVSKRYAMGRFSHENAAVMPDLRTVYQTDDGTDVALWKFVADEPGDLSAGTLHAARVTQVPVGGSYRLGLEWIELGHGTDAEIEAAIRALDAKLGR